VPSDDVTGNGVNRGVHGNEVGVDLRFSSFSDSLSAKLFSLLSGGVKSEREMTTGRSTFSSASSLGEESAWPSSDATSNCLFRVEAVTGLARGGDVGNLGKGWTMAAEGLTVGANCAGLSGKCGSAGVKGWCGGRGAKGCGGGGGKPGGCAPKMCAQGWWASGGATGGGGGEGESSSSTARPMCLRTFRCALRRR